jgi:hypothetical protein
MGMGASAAAGNKEKAGFDDDFILAMPVNGVNERSGHAAASRGRSDDHQRPEALRLAKLCLG